MRRQPSIHPRTRSGFARCAAILAAAFGLRPATAWIDIEAFDLSGVADWMDENMGTLQDKIILPSAIETEIVMAFRSQADAWLAAADDALREMHPEDMAELDPYLRTAAAHVREIPALADYADWLIARLDYFSAARQAVAAIPSPPRPESIPRPPADPRPADRRPPPAARRPTPRPAPPPVDIRNRRAAHASSRDEWRKRVATHSKPARADALMPEIKQAFQSAGVPPELVWLAEIESSMNPDARSPRGAVGLFQITAPTARSLGLAVEPEDERRHPAKSADAAARYLRYLYGRFGSWPLALAAYNAGEGRVSGLLRQRKASAFDGIAEALPMETRMYVPRVLETVRLREGVDPDRLPPPG